MKSFKSLLFASLLLLLLDVTGYAQFSPFGHAVFQPTTGCYDLSTAIATNHGYGAIWNNTPIDLSRCFEARFDVDLGNLGSGDIFEYGAAFVLQREGYSALGELTTRGCGTAIISPSLGVLMFAHESSRIAIVEDGDFMQSLSGMPYPISGSGFHSVTIRWDVMTQTLSVDWESDGVDIVYTSDIVTDHFGGDPTNIIWGFTSSFNPEGGLTEHFVCVQNFTSFDCQGESIPTLSQWAKISLALLILIIGIVRLLQVNGGLKVLFWNAQERGT